MAPSIFSQSSWSCCGLGDDAVLKLWVWSAVNVSKMVTVAQLWFRCYFPYRWLQGQTRSNCFHWFRHGLLYYWLFIHCRWDILLWNTQTFSQYFCFKCARFFFFFLLLPYELRALWIIPLILVWKLCLLLESKCECRVLTALASVSKGRIAICQ